MPAVGTQGANTNESPQQPAMSTHSHPRSGGGLRTVSLSSYLNTASQLHRASCSTISSKEGFETRTASHDPSRAAAPAPAPAAIDKVTAEPTATGHKKHITVHGLAAPAAVVTIAPQLSHTQANAPETASVRSKGTGSKQFDSWRASRSDTSTSAGNELGDIPTQGTSTKAAAIIEHHTEEAPAVASDRTTYLLLREKFLKRKRMES